MSYIEVPSQFRQAFPARPLKVYLLKNEKVTGLLVSSLFVLVMAIFWCWYLAPDILTDYKINENPVSVNAKITGQCNSRFFIATECDISIYYQGNKVDKIIHFADIGSSSYDVRAVAFAQDNRLLTVDLALEKLTNRTITAALIALLMLFGCLFSLVLIRRTRKWQPLLLALSDKPITPILLPVKVSRAGKIIHAGYEMTVAGQPFKMNFVGKSGVTPVIVTANDSNQNYALAITDQQRTVFFLVDQELKRFDLTKDEKVTLQQAISQLAI